MHPPFSINYQTAHEISLGISPTAYTLILSFLLVYHKQMALLKPTSCFNSISFEVRFKTDEIVLENFIYDTMHFQMLEIWSSEFLKYIRSFPPKELYEIISKIFYIYKICNETSAPNSPLLILLLVTDDVRSIV